MNGERPVTLEQEQARVARVIGQVGERLHQLRKRGGQLREEIVNQRKHFWDDLSINLSTPDDVIETAAAVQQQAEGLAQRERYHGLTASQIKQLERLVESPYFGRIDFRETGMAVEPIYVGRHSFRDAEDQFLVYDWRAPVSSLYYDHVPGPASYTFQSNTFEGDMTLKRQFVIESEQITSMFDADQTVGDTLLRHMLGKQATAHMQSIVATIQREQNQAVRNLDARVLVVQGVAGSGKTSVALQRVAYLLYHFRGAIETQNILLFSPNTMFSSYIEQVLPDLGEDNLQQTTFQAYVEHRIGRLFQAQTPYAAFESVLSESDDRAVECQLALVGYKASDGYRTMIDTFLERLSTQGLRFRDIRLKGKVIISRDLILATFLNTDSTWSLPNRLDKVTEWLLQKLDDIAKVERELPWVEEEIELLDREDYLRAFQSAQKRHSRNETNLHSADLEREWLINHVLARALKPIRGQVERRRYINYTVMYQELQQTLVFDALRREAGLSEAECETVVAHTVTQLQGRVLPSEDAVPFLYFMESLEGVRRNLTIRHVILDEAQDYTPFQLGFLKRLFPRSRFTVLGDPNQFIHLHTLHPHGLGDLMAQAFGVEGLKVLDLYMSYRSTAEIVQFTRPILGTVPRIDAFMRHGEPPCVVASQSMHELHENIVHQVLALRGDGHRTVAIVTKTLDECQQAEQVLRDKLDLQLITPDTMTYQSGILLIPSYLSKGIEFDAVVVYNASSNSYARPFERRLLYTVCTRAMHALIVNYIGWPSPFLKADELNQREDQPLVE